MNIQRGDVLKARFPHASGGRGKKRPVVVVQADVYNQRLRHAVVAQVTTNLDEKDDPVCLFVEASSAEAKAAGLDRDCLICCTLLSLMTEDRLKEKIGNVSGELLSELDDCLKAALGIG
ncbi:MAG: type II toxin-antitoxin system PemK/MazF family toxin [Planctomycetes bacterium]|nr:type II toxin-antitoxin system PemK/MazF family toxin [Planctomycetota bacterium]